MTFQNPRFAVANWLCCFGFPSLVLVASYLKIYRVAKRHLKVRGKPLLSLLLP